MATVINTQVEQNLWLKYYEKYLNGEYNLSAIGAAGKADEILKEFKERNKYEEKDWDD